MSVCIGDQRRQFAHATKTWAKQDKHFYACLTEGGGACFVPTWDGLGGD